jgi:cation diffusion facilitator CzcD-associated flavoprotein CzcO
MSDTTPSVSAAIATATASGTSNPTAPDRALPFLIIGAGPAGLVAGRALSLRGIPFEIVERHSDVGGIWDIANPGSPMYESAHFISSKTLSGFPGYPMPDEYPDYPNHRQILEYIRGYAKHCDLYPRIRFQTAVERIEAAADGTWTARLRTAAGGGAASAAHVNGAASGAHDEAETRRYAGVIIATGHQWEPRYPKYPGKFSGECYHSRDYHSADQFKGKRVLIVGAGNSGADIACDAARSAAFAALSVRRGYYFIPKHIMGKPADVFAHGGPQLPTRIAQPVLAGLLRILVGDPSQFGLPKPDHKLFESHPIVNTQVLHYLAHGDLVARPDVERLEGERVRFIGGRSEEYDTIVWATGYAVSMPFLDRETFPWAGTRPDLFLSAFDRQRDNLFVLGLLESDGGGYPMMYRQAELIAQAIHDQRENPRQAEAFRRLKQTRPDLTGGVKYLKTERNDIYVQYAAYHAYMEKLLKRMAAGKL